MHIRGCQIGDIGPQPFPPLQILQTWQKQAKMSHITDFHLFKSALEHTLRNDTY